MGGGMGGMGGPMMGGMGGPPLLALGMDSSIGRMGSQNGGDEMAMLRRENAQLRLELEELKKKNEGMKATNQFLLEENANIRIKQMTGGLDGKESGGSQGGYSNSNSYYSTQGGFTSSTHTSSYSGGGRGAGGW